MSHRFLTAAMAALFAVPVSLDAQKAGSSAERPTLRAHRVAEAPMIDGVVLNDPIWSQVQGSDQFWQVTPDDGQPASERTEVRVAYTETTLYIAVVAHDRQAEGILGS